MPCHVCFTSNARHHFLSAAPLGSAPGRLVGHSVCVLAHATHPTLYRFCTDWCHSFAVVSDPPVGPVNAHLLGAPALGRGGTSMVNHQSTQWTIDSQVRWALRGGGLIRPSALLPHFACSVDSPLASWCLALVTERYASSCRPLTSQMFLRFVLTASCVHVQ